ncbi:MAG: hypothetical protein FWF80_05060, partial [Defluviitaleaceae bacterium]|nr:hypothetical protein [Defluviitaleaceae bacterium]
MLKKFFAFLILAATVVFPSVVYAAQTTRTLQPDNVYEFVGRDARVVSHVNVMGGRYDIVLLDADGEVTRFGRASGRFSVSGTGMAEITPAVPISVTFDSSRFSVTERQDRALREFEILPEENSLRIENTTNDPLQIRLTGVADFVIFNRVGDATNFAVGDEDDPLQIITIPPRGAVMLESYSEEASVYFPSRWYGEEFLVERSDTPALKRVSLVPNEARTFIADENLTLQLVGEEDLPISYEYVIRGQDGHVISYGEADGNQLVLAPTPMNPIITLTITPLEPGLIYFPYTWLENIEIENGEVAPVHLSLWPRESIEISNTDPLRSHTIIIRCPQVGASEFSFEYVMLYDDEVFFDVTDDFLASQASIEVPAGAVVTLTAIHAAEYLAIRIPDVSEITARNVTTTALVRHTLGDGESVFVTFDINAGENARENGDDAKILIQTEESVDYVLYDEDGEIISFGRTDEYFLIEETQSALLTAADDTAVLIFPREPLLTLEESDVSALVRLEISYGEILQINNNDRWYNRVLLVQNENERDSEFDYVITNAQNNILDYGSVAEGRYVLPNSGRITLAPRRGSAFSVAFPAEHERHFRIREAAEQPLHRINLTPGNSVVLHNRTEYEFIISNNSSAARPGGPGFHALG